MFENISIHHLPTETCNGELIDFFFSSAIFEWSKARVPSNNEFRYLLTKRRINEYFNPYCMKYLKEIRNNTNTHGYNRSKGTITILTDDYRQE